MMRHLEEACGFLVDDEIKYRMVSELAQLYIREREVANLIVMEVDPTTAHLLADQMDGMHDYASALRARTNSEWGGNISAAIYSWVASNDSEPLASAIQRWCEEQGNKEV